jgi:hypothetical protein
MDNKTAVETVHAVRFMPTWELSAIDLGGDTIMVRVTWETFNSDHDNAVRNYRETVVLERMLMVAPQEFATPDELHAALLMWLVEIQIHETREFFRVGESFRAPFHPHRPEGERLWDNLITNPNSDVMAGAIPLGL